MLEIADIEFDRLQKEIDQYKKTVENEIIENPENVDLNQDSINSLLQTNSILNKAREIIVKNTGCKFHSNFKDMSSDIERLKLFEINNIGQLEKIIHENEKPYLSFVMEFTKDKKHEILNFSLPIFYFQHYLASKTQDEEFIIKYFKEGKIHGNIENAKRYIEIYKKSISYN